MEPIQIASLFTVPAVTSCKPFGNGHINDTFCVETEGGRYILQKINTNVFPNVTGLMQNICAVTSFLKESLRANGGDPDRETMTPVPVKDTGKFAVEVDGKWYRVYTFVEDSVCYDAVENPEQFETCGFAFGDFQRKLRDFPAQQLCEVIENFHNTEDRFAKFEAAVAADVCGRAKDVQPEIEFAMAHKPVASWLLDLWRAKKIPLRVTHNDTKLNNILFDAKTNAPLCVVDLDTIMPGFAAFDFGDSIRFGATTAAEDEVDLSRVHFDLSLYEYYTRGFLRGVGGAFGADEIDSLPMGAIDMTLECGVRFLTDYLSGDTYFKIHRPNHNLDRCRTQFKLVAEMEAHRAEMDATARRYGAQFH